MVEIIAAHGIRDIMMSEHHNHIERTDAHVLSWLQISESKTKTFWGNAFPVLNRKPTHSRFRDLLQKCFVASFVKTKAVCTSARQRSSAFSRSAGLQRFEHIHRMLYVLRIFFYFNDS